MPEGGEMSIPVALERLHEETLRCGPSAYLLTVADDGRPHAVATELAWAEGELVVKLGKRSASNLRARPLVSLLWPPLEAGGYSLIVDATAALEGEGEEQRARLTPTRGVLHRPASGGVALKPGCSADCVPLLR
jgi:Pyridoxamine 5'-phosphate oxidase